MKFVSDLRQVGGWWFSPVLRFPAIKLSHDITEILLKVAFNPITPTATMTHYPDSEPTNLGLTPEYCILQSSIIFCCKIPILHQSLAKYARILLVMADRTDECHELCKIDIFFSQIFKKKVMVKTSSSGGERQNNKHHQGGGRKAE
jgi:hypothetical protein